MLQIDRLLVTFVFLVFISLHCNGQSSKSSLPSRYQCGNANSPKILNGREVGIGEMAWTALIQYRKPNGQQSFNCAGSLINERYVLTAAHCVSGIPKDWQIVGVRLGEHDLGSDQDCEEEGPFKLCSDPQQDIQIEKTIVHEDFDATQKNHWNDIALIRLERSVTFSEYISPICLPVEAEDRQRNNTGQRAVEIGWSRTVESKMSNKRQLSTLTIQDQLSCKDIYKNKGVILSDKQLCGNRKNYDLICHAIAGSPLMQTVGRTHFQYGISSFGPTQCDARGIPDVFTNVAKFVDWIETKLE